MPSTRAGKIMVPIENYPRISFKSNLNQAVHKLEKATLEAHGKTSLPRALLVYDNQEQILGIVRRRDILSGLEPKFMCTMANIHQKELYNIEVDADLANFSSEKIGEAMKAQSEILISEVMKPIVATVEHDDHLAKVIYEMLSHDVNLLLVKRDGRIIGVVRSIDVFREVADLLR